MKPENHAIRQLEKQLAAASPEAAVAIERVILSLTSCIMNGHDPHALAACRRGLEQELAALEKLRAS